MVQKSYRVEDENTPEAIKILEENGFTNIVRMPRLALYDFEAIKDSKTVYIEFRCRSPDKAPVFTFKKSKLERLRELRDTTGRDVYILLLRKPMYRLFKIEEFSTKMKPFNIVISGKKVNAVRFPVKGELTNEEILRIIELRDKEMTQEEIAEEIGCSVVTVRKVLRLPKNKIDEIRKTAKPAKTRLREKPKPRLNRLIAVKVDNQTYKWLEKVQDVLFQEDMSSTVRALFRIMQFLIETDQINIPTKEQLDRFADFINEK